LQRYGVFEMGRGRRPITPGDPTVNNLALRPYWLPVALAAAITTGCASPEALRQADESKCNSFGFHPGTDGFASCMQKLATDRENNSPFSAANIAAAAAQSMVPAMSTCAGTHNDSSKTTGTATATTTGVPGNSTTTGTSSSETNSSGTSFSACVGN